MTHEFITHEPGPCPVELDSVVTVKFADGRISGRNGTRARFWTAGSDWWKHEGDPKYHIVGYRVEAQ